MSGFLEIGNGRMEKLRIGVRQNEGIKEFLKELRNKVIRDSENFAVQGIRIKEMKYEGS